MFNEQEIVATKVEEFVNRRLTWSFMSQKLIAFYSIQKVKELSNPYYM